MTDQPASIGQEVEQEAQFGIIPVLPHERVWGFGDFTWVNVGLAIATWAFLIGGSMASFVNLREGIAAAVIGNVIAVALMALSTCVPSGKYGLEQYTLARSILGRHGVKIIVFVWLVAIEFGWANVLSVMFGRSSTHVVNELAHTSFGYSSLVVTAFAVLAIVISWLILAKGPVSIKWFNTIVAPGLFIIQIVMVILILHEKSWGQLTAIAPLEPFGNRLLDFTIAVEFNLAAGFSWWNVMGSLARVTKTKRAAFWPNMIGLFAAAVIGEIVGLMSALALGSSDPTVWMIPIGGVALGVVALVWIAFANMTSIVSIIYSTCLALKQVGGAAFAKVSWGTLTGLFFVGPAILTIWPGLIYDHFFQFLLWSGVAYAPLSGIWIIDYFILRRQWLDLRAIYETGRDKPYAFWRGWNPAGLIALGAGSISYIIFLNPASLNHIAAFKYTTASLPSFAIGAAVYWILTEVWVKRAGKGGYDRRPVGSVSPMAAVGAETGSTPEH